MLFQNGLAQCLELYKNTLVNLMFPRCHYIRNQTDYAIFLEDYIITALTGTLKIIIQSIEENRIIFSKSGNVSVNYIIDTLTELYSSVKVLTYRNDK